MVIASARNECPKPDVLVSGRAPRDARGLRQNGSQEYFTALLATQTGRPARWRRRIPGRCNREVAVALASRLTPSIDIHGATLRDTANRRRVA